MKRTLLSLLMLVAAFGLTDVNADPGPVVDMPLGSDARPSSTDTLQRSVNRGVYIGRGAKGQTVRELQQTLRDLGYNITVDGDFGPRTANALRQFQRDNNLSADALVGPNTLRTLRARIAAHQARAAAAAAAARQGEQPGEGDPSDATGAKETDGTAGLLADALGLDMERPESAPGSGTSTPGAGTSTPGAGTSTPGASTSTPGTDDSAPGAVTATPDADSPTAAPETQAPPAAEEETTSGNRPPSHLVPVPYNGGTIYVEPDYYKRGGIYWPMDAHEAERHASSNNMILPNADMVTAIWRAADLKLNPLPLSPSNTGDPNFYNGGISNPRWYPHHSRMVQNQINGRSFRLVAGHKKDIIQGRRSGRVAIFGWHRSNGRPIQPVSNVHGAGYKDYSHGVRLVYPMMRRGNSWVRLGS